MSQLNPSKIYLAVGRSEGDNSRFQVHPFDGQSFVPPVTLGGGDWGDSYGCTATAFTQIDETTYLAVGRSKGKNSRFKIFPFSGEAFGTEVSGGEDWGSDRGTTALAFTELQGVTYLAVGRNQGSNSRFKIYSFDGGKPELIDSGGDDWGKSHGTTDLAFTVIDGMCHLAVSRSGSSDSPFKIYPFDGNELGEPVNGGEEWGNDRSATAVTFTKYNGKTYLAVGRSKGDNSRIKVYPFDGKILGEPISGASEWGVTREPTDLDFTEIDGLAYLAASRNEGANSRFKIYPFDGEELGTPIPGGREWGESIAATGVAFGQIDDQTFVAVGRSKNGNSRFKMYSFDYGHFLHLKDSGGDDWGSSRGTTAVATA